MTQTDSGVGSDLIGYVGPSATGVSPNHSAQIPYPTNAPQNCTWVVVANSSPFTIAVSQGQLLGQVAAFTADLYPVRSGQPLGVTPAPTAGAIAPGSDTTVYTTWFLQKPNGSYPSAIGSGATALQVATSIVSTQPMVGPGPVLVPLGPFDMTGYGSVRGTLGELSGLGPLQYLFSWQQSGGFNAVRQIGVDAGDAISLILPNLTDSLVVNVINQNVVTCQAVVELFKYTPALETFADPSTHGVLASGSVAGLANGAHQDIFTGPSPTLAYLSVAIQNNPAAGNGWNVVLSADITGNNSYAAQIYSATKLPTDDANRNIKDLIVLCAAPMKLSITNNTGAAQNVSWSLVTDTFRAG